MDQVVGSIQRVVEIGAQNRVHRSKSVVAYMRNVVDCRPLRRTGAKVDGDGIQGVRIGYLRAAVARGIRSLRTGASGDVVVAAAALEAVVDAQLDRNILSIIRAGSVEASRDIGVVEVRAANVFDRAQRVVPDRCASRDGTRRHIDGDALGSVAVIRNVASRAAIDLVVAG